MGDHAPKSHKEVPLIKPTDYRLYSALCLSESDNKRAIIDLGALRRNYRILQATYRKEGTAPRMIAVVKADAYGHGSPECVRALLFEGCDFFAVSCIEEALVVRRVCRESEKNADILILGYTEPSLAHVLASQDFIQTLLSAEYAARLSVAARNAGVTLRTHIAVDTGMNRIGFPAHTSDEAEEATAAIAALIPLQSLRLEGMFTHFATADDDLPASRARMKEQAERYAALRALLSDRGISIPFHHVCNSAASLSSPTLRFDGVRVGILLWGGALALSKGLPLSPVLRLQADISHIHTLLPGEGVSYGGAWHSDTPRRIATLPIGYADGWLRAYSGASVTLRSASGVYFVPTVGRICMDQCMIDVTDTDARVGDTVTLFGDDRQALASLAERADSIDYEALCLISSRVRRTYVDSETKEATAK